MRTCPILIALLLGSAASAQTVPPGPPPAPQQRQIPATEEIARLQAVGNELLRQKRQCENDEMAKAGDAGADHDDLERKLNDAIAHSQALDKEVARLKAKYEPETPAAAPKPPS